MKDIGWISGAVLAREGAGGSAFDDGQGTCVARGQRAPTVGGERESGRDVCQETSDEFGNWSDEFQKMRRKFVKVVKLILT